MRRFRVSGAAGRLGDETQNFELTFTRRILVGVFFNVAHSLFPGRPHIKRASANKSDDLQLVVRPVNPLRPAGFSPSPPRHKRERAKDNERLPQSAGRDKKDWGTETERRRESSLFSVS